MYNILRKPGPESNKFAHITYKLLPCYLGKYKNVIFFQQRLTVILIEQLPVNFQTET